MKSHYYPASERGLKDIGWLQSNFTFSFSNYFHPLKSAFGTLITFNDDIVRPQNGFGLHPHVNMEIISILLKGKMNHKDSIGYSTVIEEGGVQIMSAGCGLKHEEYNIGEEEVNFLQIWIQPKLQNITPRYQTRSFPRDKRKNSLVTIVTGEEGFDHCWINQNAKLTLGYFDKSRDTEYTFDSFNKCLFVFVISGGLKINDAILGKRDAIGIWDTERVLINCFDNTEFLIVEVPVNQK